MSTNSPYRYHRIAVKVGSNVITQADGTLDVSRLRALVEQIVALHRAGVEVILISSGAVASGRSVVLPVHKLDAVSSRQLFSAVGQARLINYYYELFAEHSIACGQVLTTKESLGTRQHYLNQKNCMTVMLEHGVVPIMNENDTISVTELMFTDNDELSGLVATMMHAEALVILSNVDGIYDGNPSLATSKVIERVVSDVDHLEQYVQTEKSSFGRGGMLTKCKIACKVADQGITVMIANGKRDNILTDLLQHDGAIIHTEFVAAEVHASSVKKWIAHSEGFAKGEIHINDGACRALVGGRAASLLLVGVERIEGEFEREDIARVIDPCGVQIGVGRVAYSSDEARTQIGLKGARPLIHYDYLYLD